MAVESKNREETRLGQRVFTEIEPAGKFNLADDYHQKYYLKSRLELLSEMEAIYSNPADLVNSTAAARLNGYIGRYGDANLLEEQLNKLGLSEAGKQRLLEITADGLTPGCPTNLSDK